MAITGELRREPATGNRRSAARRKLWLDLDGETGSGDAAGVTVLNLSAGGVLLRTAEQLSVGERVRLAFPGNELVGGKVVWAGSGLFGCRFDKPISQALLSAARLKSELDLPEGDPATASPGAEISGEETFGARVKRLRLARGISLIGLARLLGVSKPAVWKWERDEVRPRPETLDRLAATLGVSPSELLFGGEAATSAAPEQSALRAILAKAKSDVAQLLGIKAEEIALTVSVRD